MIDILGTPYEIVYDVPEEDLPEDSDGCVDVTVKRIYIGRFEPCKNKVANLEAVKRQTIRHEIVHAFLFESGLWTSSFITEAWGASEEITDWIALQAPKLVQAFNEAGAL